MVKTNGALKSEHLLKCEKRKKIFMLLKMVILVKRESLIKTTQSYEYIVSLKEYSAETLNIFSKSPYRKI